MEILCYGTLQMPMLLNIMKCYMTFI